MIWWSAGRVRARTLWSAIVGAVAVWWDSRPWNEARRFPEAGLIYEPSDEQNEAKPDPTA